MGFNVDHLTGQQAHVGVGHQRVLCHVQRVPIQTFLGVRIKVRDANAHRVASNFEDFHSKEPKRGCWIEWVSSQIQGPCLSHTQGIPFVSPLGGKHFPRQRSGGVHGHHRAVQHGELHQSTAVQVHPHGVGAVVDAKAPSRLGVGGHNVATCQVHMKLHPIVGPHVQGAHHGVSRRSGRDGQLMLDAPCENPHAGQQGTPPRTSML